MRRASWFQAPRCYLGRYTHRVGISKPRILRADEHAVTFATKNGRTCTVTPVEFLRRFLLHALPRGFHKLRHYGLCSSHHIAQGTIGIVRNILGTPTTGAAPGPTAGHDLPTATVMPDSTPPQTVDRADNGDADTGPATYNRALDVQLSSH